LAIAICSYWIINARDNLWYVENMKRDLSGHDIPVVALGHGDEDLRLFNAGALHNILVDSVPHNTVALEFGAQPAERLTLQIDDSHRVAISIHQAREGRANPSAAQDHNIHLVSPQCTDLTASSAGPMTKSVYTIATKNPCLNGQQKNSSWNAKLSPKKGTMIQPHHMRHVAPFAHVTVGQKAAYRACAPTTVFGHSKGISFIRITSRYECNVFCVKE
jgi:hypothetical protein